MAWGAFCTLFHEDRGNLGAGKHILCAISRGSWPSGRLGSFSVRYFTRIVAFQALGNVFCAPFHEERGPWAAWEAVLCAISRDRGPRTAGEIVPGAYRPKAGGAGLWLGAHSVRYFTRIVAIWALGNTFCALFHEDRGPRAAWEAVLYAISRGSLPSKRLETHSVRHFTRIVALWPLGKPFCAPFHEDRCPPTAWEAVLCAISRGAWP